MLTKCGGEARNRGMLCLSVFPCKRGMKRYLAGMGTSSAILGCAAVPDVPFPSDSSVLFYTGNKRGSSLGGLRLLSILMLSADFLSITILSY